MSVYEVCCFARPEPGSTEGEKKFEGGQKTNQLLSV